MIHKQGVPLAPRKINARIQFTVGDDGKFVYPPQATLIYDADMLTPYGPMNAGASLIDMGSDCVGEDVKLSLYGALAAIFESQESCRQLGADEYVPVVVEPVTDLIPNQPTEEPVE